MAVVKIPAQDKVIEHQQEVTAFLAGNGIEYERWTLDRPSVVAVPEFLVFPITAGAGYSLAIAAFIVADTFD